MGIVAVSCGRQAKLSTRLARAELPPFDAATGFAGLTEAGVLGRPRADIADEVSADAAALSAEVRLAETAVGIGVENEASVATTG